MLAKLKAKRNAPAEHFITKSELSKLESNLDALFKHLNIDIEFSRHFFERLSDARNKKAITIQELNDLFVKVHNRFGKQISTKNKDYQAVMKDIMSSLNVPFVLNINKKGMIELMSKTIMRKKNFSTPNQELKV